MNSRPPSIARPSRFLNKYASLLNEYLSRKVSLLTNSDYFDRRLREINSLINSLILNNHRINDRRNNCDGVTIVLREIHTTNTPHGASRVTAYFTRDARVTR